MGDFERTRPFENWKWEKKNHHPENVRCCLINIPLYEGLQYSNARAHVVRNVIKPSEEYNDKNQFR